jgi:hypothetical protein
LREINRTRRMFPHEYRYDGAGDEHQGGDRSDCRRKFESVRDNAAPR